MIFKQFKYLLTKKAFEAVANKSSPDQFINFKKVIDKRKSKTFLVVSESPAEVKFLTPILYGNGLYANYIPNPTMLFFNQAQMHFESCEKISKNFSQNIISKINSNGEINIITDELYHVFLMYKISSITSLIMTIESFVNSVIPDDFIYKRKNDEFNKKEIEQNIKLKEKICEIIPLSKDDLELLNYGKLCNKIIELNFLRNEFIHLKFTRDDKNMDPFIIHFEKLININLKQNIGYIKSYIELIDPVFFN